MEDVRRYVPLLAHRRGYPDDSFGMLSERICFLERRGLPGFGAFGAEMIKFAREPLNSRMSMSRPDGRQGNYCPIFAGVLLREKLEFLTTADASNCQAILAPSHPVLLLPKIAEYIRPRVRIMIMDWYVGAEVGARTVFDGFRIAHIGSVEPTLKADQIGFCQFPEGQMPLPEMKSGHVEEVVMPICVMSQIDQFIGS